MLIGRPAGLISRPPIGAARWSATAGAGPDKNEVIDDRRRANGARSLDPDCTKSLAAPSQLGQKAPDCAVLVAKPKLVPSLLTGWPPTNYGQTDWAARGASGVSTRKWRSTRRVRWRRLSEAAGGSAPREAHAGKLAISPARPKVKPGVHARVACCACYVPAASPLSSKLHAGRADVQGPQR